MQMSGRAVTRGIVWSLFGEGLPLVVALFAIPGLIEGYGAARFGVLTLVWVAITYFGFFDLGINRALTQVVAKHAGQSCSEHTIVIIWTALAVVGLLGLIGSALVAVLTPWLIEAALTMPDQMLKEAKTSFFLVAMSIPLLTVSQGLRGVLEAHLKFGIINAVNIPLSSLTLLGPLVLLPYSNSLVPAVAAVVLSRVAGGAVYFWFCLKIVPDMRLGIRLSLRALQPLLRFGSWMTVSNVIGPLMVFFDRFVIGAVISVTATAYYSAPYDLVTRLSFVARAFAGVLFPAFATSSSRDPAQIVHLYARGAKYTFIVLFPPIFLAVVFAPELLNFWLGSEFSQESARVLQVLAPGVLANCVANIPFALIQGLGRSDLTAKLHLVETPFYLVLLWWGVSNFGIEGAAFAWSLRVTIDMVLLFVVARRLSACPATLLTWVTAALLSTCIIAAVIASITDPTIKLLLVVAMIAAYLAISWQIALSPGERRYLLLRGRMLEYLQPGE